MSWFKILNFLAIVKCVTKSLGYKIALSVSVSVSVSVSSSFGSIVRKVMRVQDSSHWLTDGLTMSPIELSRIAKHNIFSISLFGGLQWNSQTFPVVRGDFSKNFSSPAMTNPLIVVNPLPWKNESLTAGRCGARFLLPSGAPSKCEASHSTCCSARGWWASWWWSWSCSWCSCSVPGVQAPPRIACVTTASITSGRRWVL